jgi:uncharacterized protein (DUF2252 family)
LPRSIVPRQSGGQFDERRRLKMAEPAHAYVRGNTVQFYEWLQSKAVRASLPAGPDIWICGDCHTGNLGPIADVKGQIEVSGFLRDLRDV